MSQSIWSFVKREPLVHFLALGALLFALQYFSAPAEEEGTVIEITPTLVDDLVVRREELAGRELTAEERERVVEDHVEEELLVREALRLGLAQTDVQVRSRLAEMMSFMLAAEPAEPDAGTVEAYFAENRDQYEIPAGASFVNVFFTNEGFEELEDPAAVLGRLQEGESPSGMGQNFWLGQEFGRSTEQELSRMLGPEFASAVLTGSVNEWFGPVTSRHGRHFVKVTERFDAEPLPLERVRDYVVDDWKAEQRRAALENQLDRLREEYTVVRTADHGGEE